MASELFRLAGVPLVACRKTHLGKVNPRKTQHSSHSDVSSFSSGNSLLSGVVNHYTFVYMLSVSAPCKHISSHEVEKTSLL
jgi:hypothetical protein